MAFDINSKFTTLRAKFTLYIFCLILLIIFGISLGIFVTQRSLLLKQLEESRTRIFKDFFYTCSESLVVKDEIQVLNTLKSIIKTHNPSIVYAGYISPDSMVLFSSRDQKNEEDFKPRILRANNEGIEKYKAHTREKIHEIAAPVSIQGEYSGTVRAGFSQTELDKKIRAGVIALSKSIFGIAVFAIIIGLVLANFVAIYLNMPIKALSVAADEIGSGNLEYQVKVDREDELGHLGHTFNDMARKLKELDELKDSFVSSVSHELRSPLSAIDGYCDFLIEGLEKNIAKEKQEKSLKIIKDATIRLTGFINNILDLAKIKAGKYELRVMPANFFDVAEDIVTLFVSLAGNKGIKLVNEVPTDLPAISADPEKIKQIITNLVGNAMKFTPEGGKITVGARIFSEDKPAVERRGKDINPKEYLEGWIADTGVGIPPDDVDKVFDKFYQVKEGSQGNIKKPKGTGLGLAIVMEIVKLHKGKIWAESVLGKGTTAKFILPLWKN